MTSQHTQVDLLVELVGLEGFGDTWRDMLTPILTWLEWICFGARCVVPGGTERIAQSRSHRTYQE